jgi:hypothetical protein
MMDRTREDYQRMREKLLEQENLIDELKEIQGVKKGNKGPRKAATKRSSKRRV